MTSTLTFNSEKIKQKSLKEQVKYVYNILLNMDKNVLEVRELLIPYFTHIIYALKEANKNMKGSSTKNYDEDLIRKTVELIESKNKEV